MHRCKTWDAIFWAAAYVPRMADLFPEAIQGDAPAPPVEGAPLADRLRPASLAEVEALFDRLGEEFPDRKEGSGHPPIGRAIKNLMNALGHRVSHDGFDEALVHEITEILDEAAQRIERLK